MSRTGRIALLATPGTLQRRTVRRVLATTAPGQVTCVGSLVLVHAAERKLAGARVDPRDLAIHFDSLGVDAAQRACVDTVILGCTHFPHLKDELSQVWPRVRYWVDPAASAAKALAERIRRCPVNGSARPRRRVLLTSRHNSAELAKVFAAAGIGAGAGEREVA